jgi:RNA polymerase sigma-70 factor (ECF subfamily)
MEDQSVLPDLATQLIVFETWFGSTKRSANWISPSSKPFSGRNWMGSATGKLPRLGISIATVKRHRQGRCQCMLVTESL